MPVFSSTHNTKAFSGGFKYRPTMSSSLASKLGSGLKVKVRTRWGRNPEATNISCTVLEGKPNSCARFRTLQRLCIFGCWHIRFCTCCQTSSPCLTGRPERGASCSPFAPYLEKNIELNRRIADALGYD